MIKKISILGSTGSIGVNTLDVVRSHPHRFQVIAMACGKNIELCKEHILEFKPQQVSVTQEADARLLQEAFRNDEIRFVWGREGNIEVATHPEADLVVSAIVGASGLVPTLRALEAGIPVALANKETLVMAGELMTQTAAQHRVRIFPVDSEHSAIFQALQGNNPSYVRKIILTASGGPFLHKTKEELETVTVADSLKHPNWKMGAKITIDSATLMNKGLEVIEARWLFDIAEEKIEVQVHPQSVIHSMVEYQDGSVMAQLGIPDMRIPIAYALSYPERLENRLPQLNLSQIQSLHFYKPDLERFACLGLARQALKLGGDAPCVLNAANEVAVQYFLEEKIKFLEIPRLIGQVLGNHSVKMAHSLDSLLKADQWARDQLRERAGNL